MDYINPKCESKSKSSDYLNYRKLFYHVDINNMLRSMKIEINSDEADLIRSALLKCQSHDNIRLLMKLSEQYCLLPYD